MTEAIQQGTEAWFAARVGKATASRVADIMAKISGGKPAASRANYKAELVCERLTGAKAESFSSAAMQWGTDHEDEARSAYSFQTNSDVEQVGFVDHPAVSLSGASPDGLVGTDGLLEIKCPNTATHIDTLLTGKVADKYVIQMQWQMACTGRRWCDFVSYDPRMPEELRLFVRRVDRDDARIAELEAEVRTFIAEVDHTCDQLKALYAPANDIGAPNLLRAG